MHLHSFVLICFLLRFPKRPNLEKMRVSLAIESFTFSLENFNLDLQNSPQKKGFGVWGSLEISFSLEIVNPRGRSLLKTPSIENESCGEVPIF